MVKVTYKTKDGVFGKVLFEAIGPACTFVRKLFISGVVEGFVKVEEFEEVNE